MGSQLSLPKKTLIGMGMLLLIYIIVLVVVLVKIPEHTTPPIFTPNPTNGPTTPPVTTPPVTTPPVSPENHLPFDNTPPNGPENTPKNFYRLGCKAALSEGIFPFSKFNTDGIFHSGTLQDYYSYDTWGFGGDTDEYSCGWSITGGKKVCPPDPKPNNPWSDEQCDICATASKDPNCIWTRTSSDCYKTLLRDPNVTFIPTYHGMDISQCYYKSQGTSNDNKLCCDPSVA